MSKLIRHLTPKYLALSLQTSNTALLVPSHRECTEFARPQACLVALSEFLLTCLELCFYLFACNSIFSDNQVAVDNNHQFIQLFCTG